MGIIGHFFLISLRSVVVLFNVFLIILLLFIPHVLLFLFLLLVLLLLFFLPVSLFLLSFHLPFFPSCRTLWLASGHRPGEDLHFICQAQQRQSQGRHGDGTRGEPVPRHHVNGKPPVLPSGPALPLPDPGRSFRGTALHWQGGQPQGPDNIRHTHAHTLLAGPRRDFRCLLCVCGGRCLWEYLILIWFYTILYFSCWNILIWQDTETHWWYSEFTKALFFKKSNIVICVKWNKHDNETERLFYVVRFQLVQNIPPAGGWE